MELIATRGMLPRQKRRRAGTYSAGSARSGERCRHVVFTDERNLRHIAGGEKHSLIWGKQNGRWGYPALSSAESLYLAVDKRNIPKIWTRRWVLLVLRYLNQRKEFNFQIERWIQRLIDELFVMPTNSRACAGSA